MKKALSSALNIYRQYRAAKAQSRLYKALRYLTVSAVVAYVLLLSFPQVLFAHEISYKNFKVYSREPLDKNIYALLDNVDARLAASEINSKDVKPKIFLTNSHGLYAFLSLYIGTQSFAKALPVLPTDNVFVNKADVVNDSVFRNSQTDNRRSLSEVIAHEVTHLLIKRKFGYWKNLTAPSWKKEGYAEYAAGGTLLDHEMGVRKWKESPVDDSGYRYFKYYMMVKYLIETRKLSVEDLFNQDFDTRALESEVLSSL